MLIVCWRCVDGALTPLPHRSRFRSSASASLNGSSLPASVASSVSYDLRGLCMWCRVYVLWYVSLCMWCRDYVLWDVRLCMPCRDYVMWDVPLCMPCRDYVMWDVPLCMPCRDYVLWDVRLCMPCRDYVGLCAVVNTDLVLRYTPGQTFTPNKKYFIAAGAMASQSHLT